MTHQAAQEMIPIHPPTTPPGQIIPHPLGAPIHPAFMHPPPSGPHTSVMQQVGHMSGFDPRIHGIAPPRHPMTHPVVQIPEPGEKQVQLVHMPVQQQVVQQGGGFRPMQIVYVPQAPQIGMPPLVSAPQAEMSTTTNAPFGSAKHENQKREGENVSTVATHLKAQSSNANAVTSSILHNGAPTDTSVKTSTDSSGNLIVSAALSPKMAVSEHKSLQIRNGPEKKDMEKSPTANNSSDDGDLPEDLQQIKRQYEKQKKELEMLFALSKEKEKEKQIIGRKTKETYNKMKQISAHVTEHYKSEQSQPHEIIDLDPEEKPEDIDRSQNMQVNRGRAIPDIIMSSSKFQPPVAHNRETSVKVVVDNPPEAHSKPVDYTRYSVMKVTKPQVDENKPKTPNNEPIQNRPELDLPHPVVSGTQPTPTNKTKILTHPDAIEKDLNLHTNPPMPLRDMGRNKPWQQSQNSSISLKSSDQKIRLDRAENINQPGKDQNTKPLTELEKFTTKQINNMSDVSHQTDRVHPPGHPSLPHMVGALQHQSLLQPPQMIPRMPLPNGTQQPLMPPHVQQGMQPPMESTAAPEQDKQQNLQVEYAMEMALLQQRMRQIELELNDMSTDGKPKKKRKKSKLTEQISPPNMSHVNENKALPSSMASPEIIAMKHTTVQQQTNQSQPTQKPSTSEQMRLSQSTDQGTAPAVSQIQHTPMTRYLVPETIGTQHHMANMQNVTNPNHKSQEHTTSRPIQINDLSTSMPRSQALLHSHSTNSINSMQPPVTMPILGQHVPGFLQPMVRQHMQNIRHDPPKISPTGPMVQPSKHMPVHIPVQVSMPGPHHTRFPVPTVSHPQGLVMTVPAGQISPQQMIIQPDGKIVQVQMMHTGLPFNPQAAPPALTRQALAPAALAPSTLTKQVPGSSQIRLPIPPRKQRKPRTVRPKVPKPSTAHVNEQTSQQKVSGTLFYRT